MSIKRPFTWKLAAVLTATLAIGIVVGAGAMLRTLYHKPGKNLVWKIERMLDRRPPDSRQLLDRGAGAWDPAAGFKIEVAAAGFDFPVRIVFHPAPPAAPDPLRYYVAELRGAIKAVTHNGLVHTVVEGLLNYRPKPGEELGLLGLTYDDIDNQLFVAMSYWDAEEAVFRNKVERLALGDDGLAVLERAIVLDMKNEATVASYQIQFCALGPDGLLYVGVGSGGRKEDAQNFDKFAGKVIRLNRDGTASDKNPYYQPSQPDSPRSYIYAHGMRNPFDIAWDPRNFIAIVSDVGPGIDRILRLEPGIDYCFANDDNQMRANALYTWGPGSGYAPTGVTYGRNDSLGPDQAYALFVGLFGAVHLPGPNEGKRITRFDIAPNGYLQSAAADFVSYNGSRFASVTDVEWGADGLYFADIYGESLEPHVGGGVIYRVVPDPDYAPPVDVSAKLSGAARGRYVFFENRCNACHILDGAGGREGPDLSNARESLAQRLLAPEYESWLRELAQREGRYFERHRPVYQSLLGLKGRQRLHAWLHHHVRDPRFDNPAAKMPSHEIADEDLDALADFLLR